MSLERCLWKDVFHLCIEYVRGPWSPGHNHHCLLGTKPHSRNWAMDKWEELYLCLQLLPITCIVLCAVSLQLCPTFETLWTVACKVPFVHETLQASILSGLPCPPPGDLPNPGIKPTAPMSPALASRFFTSMATYCLKLQMTVALKVCLRTSNLPKFWIKVRQNILRLPQMHWKVCFHFQHPIFVKQGFLQWQQEKWDYRVDCT